MQMNSLSDFIKAIPKELTTVIPKARYLYLELGKRSFYDPNYKYFMFGEEDILEYTYKMYRNPNVIICTTLAKQFVELLNSSEIKAELVQDEGHYLVAFYDEEDIRHLVDITNDLKNIQFGCKTTHFATNTIDEKRIEEIDLELGYITPIKGYTNDYWYVVRDIVQNSNLSKKRKLETVLQNLQKFGDITKPRRNGDFFYLSKICKILFTG